MMALLLFIIPLVEVYRRRGESFYTIVETGNRCGFSFIQKNGLE